MSRALLLLVLASTAWAICPNGTIYEAYFNKCYKVNTQPSGFLAAEQSCNKLGGNLVAIQSVVENAYVSGIATTSTATSFWIGANYLMDPQWSWTTGAPVNFTIWAPSQPSDPSTNQCVAVREQDNAWTKEQCYSQKPSVCQINPNTSPSPSPVPTCDNTCPANAVCSPGYTFYIGTCKCYKVFGSSNYVTFTNAQAFCGAQENGVLPKIPDNSTNEFISTLVNKEENINEVWIGLNCPNGIDSCYWQDGTPLGSFRPFLSPSTPNLNYVQWSTGNGYYAKLWTSAMFSMSTTVCQKDPTTTTAMLEPIEFQSSLPDSVISKTRRSAKSPTKKQ